MAMVSKPKNQYLTSYLAQIDLNKGSFTYDVITLGGGGGFQMMTIDDEGEGGCFGQ